MTDERKEVIARLRAQRHHADDWRTDLAELAADLLERDGARITELEAERGETRKENEWLRAYTGQSAKACVYCGLGADEQAQCERGFPGCARGDDQMLCPEVGVAIERDEARAALAEAIQARDNTAAAILMIASELAADPKISAEDTGDPRWTPALLAAAKLRAALAEARESIAQWMMSQGFATGHGDTIDGLLDELTGQVREIKERAAEAQKDAIRYLWLRQSTLRTSGLPAICIISFDGYHIRIAHDEADKYIDAAIAKEQSHASE